MATKQRDGQIMPHHSVAFRLKCERELDKLRTHLSFQLKNDMLKLLTEKSFADFTFVVEEEEIRAHSSVLKVRVPKFYNYCLAAQDAARIPFVVWLPGLRKVQLQNFFRAVYCSEDVLLEEALVLKALAKNRGQTQFSSEMTSAVPPCNGLRPLVGKSQPISSDNSSSPHNDSLEMGGHRLFPQQEPGSPYFSDRAADGEGSPCGEKYLTAAVAASDEREYSSSSECLHHPQHHTGTLADVTDPFSLSTPLDTFNVSTLNLGSDRASLTSIEDDEDMMNASEISERVDALLPSPHAAEDSGGEESAVDAPQVFYANKPSLVASFLLQQKKCGFDGNISIDSVDGTVPCIGGLNSSSEGIDEVCTPYGGDGTVLVSKSGLQAPCTELTRQIPLPSQDLFVERIILMDEGGRGTAPCPEDNLTANQQMVCSHESKEGDSGICSFGRRLSGSLGSPPFHGRRFCEMQVAASPSESLPKDDSLEFCPDSLASSVNAVSAAAMFGLPSPQPFDDQAIPEGGSWLLGEEAQEKEPAPRPEILGWTGDNGSPRPMVRPGLAWAESDGERDHLSSFDGSEPRRWSLGYGEMASVNGKTKPSIAIVMPYNVDDDVPQCVPPTNRERPLEGAAADETGPQHAAQSVLLDFVPFLKETPQPNPTPENHHVVGNRQYRQRRGSSPDLPDDERNLTNFEEDHVSSVPRHLSEVRTDDRHLESLPIITGYAPPLLSANGGPPVVAAIPGEQASTSDVDNLIDSGQFYPGLVNGVPHSEAADREDAVRRQKQDNFFMFIDVGKANSLANKSMEAATNEGGPEGSGAFRDPPPSAEIVVGSREANATLPPPPVYMYIEATPGESGPGHHVRIRARAPEKSDSVLRRRGKGARSRPKSESAATLAISPPLDEGADIGRADKRMSLGLDNDDDDVTYSIDNSLISGGGSSARDSLCEEKKRSSRRSCSKLGSELLRMFLDEVNTDVTIRVGEREMKAHKSILVSRCVYFAAMLSGGWIESAGNVIKLQGFSYEAVHFAVRHIYGGAAAVPDELDVSELASLSDMLGLEGLKEVVALALKIKYCHFFHKPCATCTASISECLLIAASFGLDDLQESCLKWIARHRLKVWPTKAFAALPEEILHKCYLMSLADLSPFSVPGTLLECDKLMATIPHVKWAEPVFSLTTRLTEACSEYLSLHFADVLRSDAFLALRTGQGWNLDHTLETTFLLAVERLPLEVACQAYVHLSSSLQQKEAEDGEDERPEADESFESLVNKIHRQVEHFLIHNANRMVRCSSWGLLSPALQKKIKDAAVIVFEFGKPTAPPPRLSSLNRKFTGTRAVSSTASSASPIAERSATRCTPTRGGASKSLTSSVCIKRAEVVREQQQLQHQHHDKSKAATLPRAGTGASKEFLATKKLDHHHQIASSPVAVSAPRGGPPKRHTRTLPLAKDETRAEAENRSKDRVSGASKVLPVAPVEHVTPVVDAIVERAVSKTTVQRPKSWPAKERPAATVTTPVGKPKENLVKEASKEHKPVTATNGVPLRTAVRIGNGISKTSSPVPRPKSAGYTPGTSRLAQKPLVCSVGNNARDPKGGNIRKAISTDLHSKDKDDSRPKFGNRPRSDDVSSSAVSKRPAQRPNFARTSRPSTSKV